MSFPHHTFTPSPADEDYLLHLLASPDHTLADIASRFKTTVFALSTWMDLPETQAKVRTFERAVCARTRLIAINHLPAAVSTAVRILQEYNDEESRIPEGRGQGVGGASGYSLRAFEQRRRSRETARRAASLLLRLARVHPSVPPPMPPDVAPKGGSRCGSLDVPENGCPPSRTSRATTATRLPAPTLEDLLAQAAALALDLNASNEVAAAAAPAPTQPDRAPAPKPRAHGKPNSRVVEISVPQLNHVPPESPQSDRNPIPQNGHHRPPALNEHWP